MNDNWKLKTTAFLFSQCVTMFGTSVVQCAIIWYVAKETSSGIMVTLLSVCAFLPQILISPFGGVWADRHNRKMLIIMADGSIALITLVLAFIMMSGRDFTVALLLVTGIRAVGAGIQMPAVNALLPQIVPADKLMKVAGINGSMQSVIGILSPIASGAILSAGPIYYIMFVDVVTAIIGISIFLTIKVGKHQKALSEEKTDYFADLKEGISYSVKNSFVRKLLLLYMGYTVLIVPSTFLNVLMVTRTFGDSYWHLTLNEIVFFVGAIIGGVLIGIWGGFKNKVATLFIGLLFYGACTFAVGFIYSFILYLVFIAVMGICMPLAGSPLTVLLQQKVDPDMQGRVFSLLQIIASAFMLVGVAIFGPLADIVSIQLLMIITGAALMLQAVMIRLDKEFYKEGI